MKLLLDQPTSSESAEVLVRSRTRAVSRRMGFSAVLRERMELVAKELMSNQAKFAGGSGLMQVWEVTQPRPALDLFALDYGPGIANLPQALEDGFTTARTMGKGLGTVQRLGHECEFYTIPKGVAPDAPWHGTAVWVRFYGDEPKKGLGSPYQFGVYLRAYQDDIYNGDLIDVRPNGQVVRWLHVDGLGHGEHAAQAIEGIEQANDDNATLVEVLHRVSSRLQGTRGAVAMMAELNFSDEAGAICGVGDMAAYVICNGQRRAISFSPGVLGHEHRSFEPMTMQFPSQALMITSSDGLRRNWQLQTFPGLWRLHPQLIAMFLGNVASRGSDDKSIFVIRTTPKKGDR